MTSIVVKITKAEVEQPLPLFWVPHDKCRYSYDLPDWRYNPLQTGRPRGSVISTNKPQPEVYRLDPEHSFSLTTDYLQLLVDINPELLPDKALALVGTGLAFCNNKYGTFDQPRYMGGATVTGEVDGNRLWLKTLRADHPAPTAEAVLNDPTQWFWCVSVTPKNKINYWMRLGKDGTPKKCRMFLIAERPVYVQLDELKRVYSIQNPQAFL